MADQDVKQRQSSFKGVSWRQDRDRWRARIKIGAKDLVLGYFSTEVEAAYAYDVAARSIGRKVNFDDPPADAIVRKVRPKLVELRIQAKLDTELQEVDPQVWGHGATEGILWAQTVQKTPLDLSDANQNDPLMLAESLGGEALAIYDESVRGYRTRAKRLVWVRAFVAAAKDVWKAKAAAVSKTDHPDDLESLLANLQSQAAGKADFVDDGRQVPGTAPQPNGEVWSADCNPATLARDNSAIADAQRARTGIFAMMDEIDRERDAKRRRAEELLAELL